MALMTLAGGAVKVAVIIAGERGRLAELAGDEKVFAVGCDFRHGKVLVGCGYPLREGVCVLKGLGGVTRAKS
jgi:hypothetical protein